MPLKREMSGAQPFVALGTSVATQSGSESGNTNPAVSHVSMSRDERMGRTPRPLRPPVQNT